MSSHSPASPSNPPLEPRRSAPHHYPRPRNIPGVEPAVGLTRAGALWTALIAGFLMLILLLVFVSPEHRRHVLYFFGWKWSLPKGVAILLAAVGGGLLTVAVGTARIIQLRRAAKKHHVGVFTS